MNEAELNQNIKLAPYDRLVAATLLKLLPVSVRPNHITVARFIGSPLVFWLLWQGYYRMALAAFLIVAVTDAMDGALARTQKQITAWGTTYDGVADKFLIGGVVLVLALKHLGPTLAGVIIGLELFTVAGALYFKQRGIVRPANWFGKIKMNLQVFATVALLIDIIWAVPTAARISFWLFIASLGFGILSIIAHARKF